MQRGSSSTHAARGAPVTTTTKQQDKDEEVRRGPWTAEEDLLLCTHIAGHGAGRWNALARAAGLSRTGKSCRLRWLNYLRPDVRRGAFTAAEQLRILDLHSRWGNRWSRIASELPGRTDNEVKNFWRTKVQKHARQLGCDVGSPRFKDAMVSYLLRIMPGPVVAQQQYHSSGNDDKPSSLASSPCLSELALTATDDPPAASSSLVETSYDFPGSGSSSSSSLTSTEWTPAHEEKAVHQPQLPYGGEDSCWTMQGSEMFWSTAEMDDDLTGWVPGFTDVDADHSQMWSLDDDIWTTMQQ